MKPATCLYALAILLAVAAPLRAVDIDGRVVTASGLALDGARVALIDDAGEVGESTRTDATGSFSLSDCEALPCLILITHPRFQEQVVELRDEGAGLRVEMVPKQQIFDRIDVTAGRDGGDSFIPASVASTEISAGDEPAAPATLTELVEGVAGVAENGQGGLFQVFSVRGVSRYRVLTLVDGMQVTSERRAGVSTSFIDPLLMGAVDVLRGPASTYYGSGALGGVVQIFPRRFDGLHVDLGFETFGDRNHQVVGWGASGWTLGFARRDASNDDAADGTALNNHFTQYSAVLAKTWEAGGRTWEVLTIPAVGDDLGKVNSDFPGRVTNYPEENHLLVRVGARSDRDSFFVYVHPNDLVTDALRVGQRFNRVTNESFDLGGNWQRRFGGEGKVSGRLGLDYFGRRGVDSVEVEDDFASGSQTVLRTLDGGQQDEASVYGSLRLAAGRATFSLGSRATWQRQENGGSPSRDDSAVTGFVGFVRPLGKGFEVTANLGTGLRFPSLSERFFSGTTGRGGVIGNPDLEPESSLNFDLGLRWFGRRAFWSAQVFRLDVDDYIERVEVSDDLLTFVNLTSGEIDGFELEGFFQLDERWKLDWNGHLLDGADDSGGPLADIPADRVQLGATYDHEAWRAQLRLQLRAAKNDPGNGEIAIPSAQLLSAAIAYRFDSGLSLTVRGENLLDEEYFASADDKATIAAGRSVGLGFSWSVN